MKDAPFEVLVRGASADDAAAIDRLLLYLDELHAEARPDLFRVPLGRPRGDDFLRRALDDADQQVLVAVMRCEVVGYAHVVIKSTPPSSYRFERRYSEIDTIAVQPAAQRLGVGRKLIEAALGWASSRHVGDHQIAVHQFNRSARALYEDLGFVPSVTVLRRMG
jgi:diamine N-acetyltransferase